MLFDQGIEKTHTVFDLAFLDLFLLEYVPINDQNIVRYDCDGVVPEINEIVETIFHSSILPVLELEANTLLAVFVTQVEGCTGISF